MAKQTKPWEDYLNVLSEILNSTQLVISHERLFKVIGKSKSQNYKILNNLLNGTESTMPLLVKIKDEVAAAAYKLKSNSWEDANNTSLEGKFFLECYKHVGYLLDSDYSRAQFEDSEESITSHKLNKLKRKFFYLAKVQAKVFKKEQKLLLETIVKSLLNEKEIYLNYPIRDPIKSKVSRQIRPLTLCQYRDDLYLLGNECQSDGSWKQKNYKISRVKSVTETTQKFSYPSQSKWNPEVEYRETSGLIKSDTKVATILVHGHFKALLLEKSFCNARLISSVTDEVHEYNFTYTEVNEFVGQLFTYAECVEIISPQSLKDHFVAKAERALSLNYNGEVLSMFRDISKKKAA